MHTSKQIATLLALLLLAVGCAAPKGPNSWKLVWQEDFNGNSLDTSRWSKISRGAPEWRRHMSDGDSLYAVKDGKLFLYGKVNHHAHDSVPVVTGGVYTKDKFFRAYGRVEISAKLGNAQGAWPAFWMKPQEQIKWPYGGEIDIMEHLNHDSIAYQTIHSYYTVHLQEPLPQKGAVGRMDPGGYNTYRLDWYPDSLVFFINDQRTFAYPRIQTEKEGQWPFDRPFYLLLDMQLGGGWVGPIDKKQLPVEMEIDWVKWYALPEALQPKM